MAEITEPLLSGPTTSSSSSNCDYSNNGSSSTASMKVLTQPVLSPKTTTPTRRPLWQKYSRPLPIRTFPLPTFYPSNPVSLFHLAFTWLSQVLLPPSAEPRTIYEGVWSSATRSVHVTDLKSMNDLWSQGFYGKGSLSRSEPNWLHREKARLESLDATTSEQRTVQRREERADTKWERGRSELEAIEQRRREEDAAEAAANAEAAISNANANMNGNEPNKLLLMPAQLLPSPSPSPPILPFKAPVGPLELLALPNSEADLKGATASQAAVESKPHVNGSPNKPETINSNVNGTATPFEDVITNDTAHSVGVEVHNGVNGTATLFSTATSTIPTTREPLKRQKSVRFSPTVESTTFVHSDPPSPNNSSLALSKKATAAAATDGHLPTTNGSSTDAAAEPAAAEQPVTIAVEDIPNKEHLQLSPEEAFFLAYAVGALRVVDPETQQALSTPRVFELCRQFSHYPPRLPTTSTLSLSTDDPFLIHYVVYHHFRSLGWVPRHGIKFGVDWMLYGKGPALDHAEFGVLVLPSYSHPTWKAKEGDAKSRSATSWHLLNSVNRVLSTVFKNMVLVYVDIPPPVAAEDAGDNISALLSQYRIREVMVRRWSSNRNRD
ncbi:tRNA splicing endonuclease subunit sen2 [Sporothrix eucalyptigena]|uniref:tRNA-intron lyase n=1 Tax=Sporothrix eucalyptigena TaxID=1812306 RepID=A0ABP0BZ29_9PEZI